MDKETKVWNKKARKEGRNKRRNGGRKKAWNGVRNGGIEGKDEVRK